MNLQSLKEILDKDDFTTFYFEKSNKLPFDRLNLILPTDVKDQLVLEMIYTPGMDKILKGYKLFQYFVRLPFDLQDERIEDLKTFILKLNMGIPMMGFGLNEEDKYIYFKSISMIPNKEELSDDLQAVIVENIYMIGFLLNRFYDVTKGLATGKKSLEKTLKKLV